MDVQHDLRGFLGGFAEIKLQHLDDEFHRCEIIIEHDDFVKRRTFDFGRNI